MVCLLLEGIHFSNAPAEEILSDSSHTQLISHDRNDLLKAIFFHMEKTHKSRPISAEMVSSLLLLLREMEADGLVKNPIRPEKAALVDTIRSYIAHNFDKKLTLQDLSSSVYISPCYMDRLFKKETGISINRYITECRMGEAERSLYQMQKNWGRHSYTIYYEQEDEFVKKDLQVITSKQYPIIQLYDAFTEMETVKTMVWTTFYTLILLNTHGISSNSALQKWLYQKEL